MFNVSPDTISFQSRSAYWSLGTRAAPTSIALPSTAAFLYLDPATTSPNVVLGIFVPGMARRFMVPGDCVALPLRRTKGQVYVQVWNPLQSVVPTLWLPGLAGAVGFVGLQAGEAHELAALSVRGWKCDPAPPGNVLWLGELGTVAGGAFAVFPSYNLQSIRVSVVAVTSGAWSANPPIDFACTLTPGVLGLVLDGSLSPPAAPATPAVGNIDVPGIDDIPSRPGGTNLINAGQALNYSGGLSFTQVVTLDASVLCGAGLVSLLLTALSGSALDTSRVGVIVEGR